MTDVKRALVTGAAQGIGLAVAQALAAQGVVVAMADIQAEELAQAAHMLPNAAPYVIDVRDMTQLDVYVAHIERDLGALDYLVNNAGIVKTQDLLAVTVHDWETIMGVNAGAPLFLMQAAGRRMMARGQGAIVNMASVAGRSARPEQTLYGASKATLLHMTKSAAAAFGPHGVRVNAVCPGVVQTAMTEQIWRERHPDDVASILRSIPLRRTATPAEIASVVTWLLGDGASYINGQAINVCGGLEMD